MLHPRTAALCLGLALMLFGGAARAQVTNDVHGSVFGFWSPYWLTGSQKLVFSRSTALTSLTAPDYATTRINTTASSHPFATKRNFVPLSLGYYGPVASAEGPRIANMDPLASSEKATNNTNNTKSPNDAQNNRNAVSGQNNSPSLWRSVLAVGAGLLTTVGPVFVTDTILAATGVDPPSGKRWSDGRFLLALSYRVPVTVAGGFVTGKLSPRKPLTHALVLAGLVAVGSYASAILLHPDRPAWYPLGLVGIAVPGALFGEWLSR